jgi:dTMP kinase
MSKKPVIVFEGIEGSGKSLHILNVAKYLKKKNIDFIKVREPGGCINSEKIRKIILDKNLISIRLQIYYFILLLEVKI